MHQFLLLGDGCTHARNLYRYCGGFPLEELLNWSRMKEAGLSLRDLVTMVYRHEDLLHKPYGDAPSDKFDMPGPDCDTTTAYFRDNDWSWNHKKLDPHEELDHFGSDVVYSWPLICEEYAGVSEGTNGEGHYWGDIGVF